MAAVLKGALAVIALAVACALGYVGYHLASGVSAEPEPLANPSYIVNGSSQTCEQLMGAPCNYNLQSAYNQWGQHLDDFTHSVVLSNGLPKMSYADLARDGLMTCTLLSGFDNNETAFLHMIQQQHPGQEATLYFPIWTQARDTLCPATVDHSQ